MKTIACYAALSVAALCGVSHLTTDGMEITDWGIASDVRAQEPQPAPAPNPAPVPTPGATIALPAEVKGDIGTFIKIDAETNGKEVRWFAATTGLNVFPAELLKNSRSTVVTATAAGSYKLIAYTAVADVPSEPATCLVIVGTPPPGPNPPPGPGPGPGPAPNPEPSGPLAKQMATWLAPLKANGKLTKQVLTDLATNYESIAAESVAVQGVLTKSGFVAATQTQNVRVLGPDLALEMRDPFFKPLAAYMQSKNLAENDEAGHAELWRETAAAIQEVAATF
jgi:hypothetical protein